MNKLILVGNLVREPELTETSSGIAKCRFTIAVNRPVGSDGEKKADYFDCTAWRGLGENVARYCSKGKKVLVEGQVQLRTYTDKQGNDQKAVDVLCQNVEFLTPRDSGASVQAPAPAQAPREQSGQMDMFGSGVKKPSLQPIDYDDGDIPF